VIADKVSTTSSRSATTTGWRFPCDNASLDQFSEEKAKIRQTSLASYSRPITYLSIHFCDDDVFRAERFLCQ
jgi:hypothetical protein